MKKILAAVLLTGVSFAGYAQPTRTTVQNGTATNPLTWDCTCIPTPGDHIIINHALTLNIDYAYSGGSVLVNNSGSITGDIPARSMGVLGGSFTNHGTVTLGNFYHSAGTFTNDAAMNITNLYGVDLNASETNTGTITIGDSLFVNTNATFINNATASAPVIATAGTVTNNSTLSCGYLWSSGTVNHQGGTLTITTDLISSGNVNNSAPLFVDYDIWNSGTFTNSQNIDIGHSLYTGDSTALPATFTNNGLISVAADLYNNKTLNGTGRFCVAQITANSGSISGTLDICDQTGGNIDFNSGTIAGTVTFCSTSCNISVEEEPGGNIIVYPNPFVSELIVKTDSNNEKLFVLTNAIGQEIVRKKINSATCRLNLSELNNGIYFYSLSGDGKLLDSGRLLKK